MYVHMCVYMCVCVILPHLSHRPYECLQLCFVVAAYMHLLALALEAQVPLTMEDFNPIGARVPLLANMSPHGKWHMSDLHKIGGACGVMMKRNVCVVGGGPYRLCDSRARPHASI